MVFWRFLPVIGVFESLIGLLGPVGEACLVGEGIGMSGTGEPFADRHQCSVQIAGFHRVSCFPGPPCQVCARTQGPGMFSPEVSLMEWKQSAAHVAGSGG